LDLLIDQGSSGVRNIISRLTGFLNILRSHNHILVLWIIFGKWKTQKQPLDAKMETYLMREFEELEGIVENYVADSSTVLDDKDDEDILLSKPLQASALPSTDVYQEVRGQSWCGCLCEHSI
jgi:hypothetical protein